MFYPHVNSCVMLEVGCGGGAGGNSLSFASPKESKQRKGDPQSGSLRWRCGQPALLDSGGGPNNSPAAQTSLARPSASICAARPSQDGFGERKRNRVRGAERGAFCGVRSRLWSRSRSAVLAGLSSTGGDGSKFQMSEGCAADKFLKFPAHPSSARNRVAALTAARLSFGSFSLAKQRKGTSRRATPGLVMKGNNAKPPKASTSSARTGIRLMGLGGQA